MVFQRLPVPNSNQTDCRYQPPYGTNSIAIFSLSKFFFFFFLKDNKQRPCRFFVFSSPRTGSFRIRTPDPQPANTKPPRTGITGSGTFIPDPESGSDHFFVLWHTGLEVEKMHRIRSTAAEQPVFFAPTDSK
jgi:hypothetical protein